MKKIYFLFLFVATFSFAQPGNLCTDPIVISGLPFTTTDNTANYGDNYDPPTTTSIACGAGTSGNYYLGGNDVIYAYTPTSNGYISLQIPSALAWTGLFVYTSCTGIGTPPLACSCSSGAGNRVINNLSVTAGQTYFIVISSWPTPQTVAYTLNVTTAPLDAADFSATKTIELYPNPVKNDLTINSGLNIKSITVFNINGQRMMEKTVSNNTVSLSELAVGYYLVQLTDTDGVVYSKKLLKSN
jgi:hypothetical protein